MSTLKSSAENLTLNADGSGNDVIIQSNASTLVTVDGATGNVGIGDTNPDEAKLSIDNVAAGDAGLKVVQAQDEKGIFIDQNGNNNALYIESASTTENGATWDVSSLTTGSIANFYSNSASTSTRKLVQVKNDHASATGTTALYVKQDSTGLAADFTGTGGIRSAGGILFGSDTAAANALNDYEEGDWTPVMTGGSTAGSYTYDTSRTNGRYTKIGNQVILRFSIRVSGTSSAGVGGARIAGLPFTSVSTGVYPRYPGTLLGQSTSTNAASIFCCIEGEDTYVALFDQTTTNCAAIDVTDADLHDSIYAGLITYETAS